MDLSPEVVRAFGEVGERVAWIVAGTFVVLSALKTVRVYLVKRNGAKSI